MPAKIRKRPTTRPMIYQLYGRRHGIVVHLYEAREFLVSDPPPEEAIRLLDVPEVEALPLELPAWVDASPHQRIIRYRLVFSKEVGTHILPSAPRPPNHFPYAFGGRFLFSGDDRWHKVTGTHGAVRLFDHAEPK